MATSDVKIIEVQFKRGLKKDLIAVLKDDKRPKLGEPILELDTYRLKFGDGERDYEELDYFNTSTAIDFSIVDPIAGEALVYDVATKSWTNKVLADNESLVYLKNRGLTIWGYQGAKNGDLPYAKKTEYGNQIEWGSPEEIQPFSKYLNTIVDNRNEVLNYYSLTENAKEVAEQNADKTENLIEGFMQYIENKFYQCTAQEYNNLTTIDPDTIYIITDK